MVLYDPWEGGHHGTYMAAFSRAMLKRWHVICVAPPASLDALHEDVECLPIAPHMRAGGGSGALAISTLLSVAERRGAGRIVHLYGDPDLRALSRLAPPRVPLSVLVLSPRSHYPAAFGNTMHVREQLGGLRQDRWIARASKRGVGTFWSLDPFAVARWHALGVDAHHLMEPALSGAPTRRDPASERDATVLLYGHLSRRKGLPILASALAAMHDPPALRLLGTVDESFRPELDATVRSIEGRGVEVQQRIGRVTEDEAQEELARAGVVALAYRRHFGMSRVLLEAAWAGSPVVASRFGLVGWHVERWGLGRAVRPGDPTDLGRSLTELLGARPSSDLLGNLFRFAYQHRETAFTERVAELVGQP